MMRRPPRSTRTDTLFPYTTLFRSFRSLERAQAAVRTANAHQDVTVIVHGGVWTRTEPLVFTAKDGGQNGFAVRWRGADDARPLITGGMAVADWQLQDKARGIYTAAVPRGPSARHRSKERRVGKELGSTSGSRWSPYH